MNRLTLIATLLRDIDHGAAAEHIDEAVRNPYFAGQPTRSLLWGIGSALESEARTMYKLAKPNLPSVDEDVTEAQAENQVKAREWTARHPVPEDGWVESHNDEVGMTLAIIHRHALTIGRSRVALGL